MANTPSNKRLHVSNEESDDLETLKVPKELIAPLKGLIAKMCEQLDNKTKPFSTEAMEFFGGNVEDIEDMKILTLSNFKSLKMKLMNNLKGFRREEVNADLPEADFERFKVVRRNLSRWYRLGDSSTKRNENPFNNAHQLVDCNVSISPTVGNHDMRNKIMDFFESKRQDIEEHLEIKVLDELHGKSKNYLEEFTACTEKTDKLIWAKAFRSALAGAKSPPNSRHLFQKKWTHSSPNTAKSVSFDNANGDSFSRGETSGSSESHYKGKSILKKDRKVVTKNSRHFNTELSDSGSDTNDSDDTSVSYRGRNHHHPQSFRNRGRGRHHY
jgi:hypothetical protein